MPITSLQVDHEARAVVLVADTPVPVDRLWQACTDPRQLERFWGPPDLPATFTSFDLRPGGLAHYRMTSSEDERFHAVWRIAEVDQPRRIVFADLFTDADGAVDPDLPAGETVLLFEPTAQGSRVTLTSSFDSGEDLDVMLAMGMEEGYRQAFGQLDDVVR